MRRSAILLLLAACAPPPYDLDPAFYALCSGELQLTDEQCLRVSQWRLPDELPPSRGNRYADDVAAAELGRAIFFDSGFSNIPDISCASCHRPELAFTDGAPVSEVIAGMPGGRNSPSLLNVAWNDQWVFWDGRADSLWSQPLFAFENEIEMDTTRLEIAHRITDAYRAEYEPIFGALPDLSGFPPAGKPGDPAFDELSDGDRDAINRIAANVGKALEAYMRRIAGGDSALDRYLDGDGDALTEQQARGLSRFVQSGCQRCHSGPAMSDGEFHPSTAGSETDLGRATGIPILLANEFNGAGPYFDTDAGAPLRLPNAAREDDLRAFRSPSMRNILLTAPYQHDGSRSLEEILAARGLLYEEGDEVVLAAFMEALTGSPPPAEWAHRP
jgi:cytochrome c peroxidase